MPSLHDLGMNKNLLSRRLFLKQTSLTIPGLALAGAGSRVAAAEIHSVSIITLTTDVVASTAPPQWAIAELQRAIEAQHHLPVHVGSSLSEAPAGDLVIIAASSNIKEAREIIAGTGLTMPSAAETLLLAHGSSGGRTILLACGNDARGLAYAVLELTDRVLCSNSIRSALNVTPALVEQPANRIRSICRSFQSELEDKPWFHDRRFWTDYLTMLATQRFNRFNLCLGLGYNTIPRGSPETYLLFAYPFFVSLPEYRGVSARNLPPAERDMNLQILKFIGEECSRRGLEFQLGLWFQAYDYGAGANYPIDGLTEVTHAPYCRDALVSILKTCQGITGVTFRVHRESGIPSTNFGFWKTLFDAFPRVGRTLEIDMHAKECRQQHIDMATATGMRVVVSPKYWAEHKGVPYHQASLRKREQSHESDPNILDGQASRYGYSNFLKNDRTYDVLHRIWPGTQRVLLSGDPVFAAGYGRASSFCGSAGVEWDEPLSFKGRDGTGIAGGRCAYLDSSLNPTLDFQKFLYTYRVWGRLIYNPHAAPQTWRRYLVKQFGPAARPVEDALAHAAVSSPWSRSSMG